MITGASGFLGSLVAAALLADQHRRIVLPVRSGAQANCLLRLRIALLDRGVHDADLEALLGLAEILELPARHSLQEMSSWACSHDIEDIVHCAGCVDYFDTKQLHLANVEFTGSLLNVAKAWKIKRFWYLSSAYCSGYRSGTIPEALHPDPDAADEPTEYTRTKRLAEWRVAESGIPFVIVRPSVIIGDSRTGEYRGKNYGLYQMWRAIEGLLCREYYPVWYTVAPPIPVNFVHQDAFQNAFLAIYRDLPGDSIIHVVANAEKSPTMRDLCWMWAHVYCPAEIHTYPEVDNVPLRSIPVRQRRFLELASKNFEIATRTWNFSTDNLRSLCARGLYFPDATLTTITRCQQRYIEGSVRIQEHMKNYCSRSNCKPRLVECVP